MYVYGVLTLERGSNDLSFLVARRYSRDSSRISVPRRASAVNDDAQRFWRTDRSEAEALHHPPPNKNDRKPFRIGWFMRVIAGRVIYQRVDYSLNRLSNTLFGRRDCFVIAFV